MVTVWVGVSSRTPTFSSGSVSEGRRPPPLVHSPGFSSGALRRDTGTECRNLGIS